MVDGDGRVHGLDGLVVADASIMPTIPRANTNLSTIALAERTRGDPRRRRSVRSVSALRPPGPLWDSRQVHIPPLSGATGWLGSEPLSPAELRGHVVLVNFWTLTCINWLRQEPYVRAWSQAYRDDGLIVIGVHTPEFSFEHDIDGVRLATTERAIDYPVAVDNDYEIWQAFANHYWPALYFADTDGVIRDSHFGEGRYEQSERVVQRLLGVERELVSVEGRGVEAAADWDHLRTPETYLGYWRSESFASPRTPRPTIAAPTRCPSACA